MSVTGASPAMAHRPAPAPGDVRCPCLAGSLADELASQQRLIDRAVRGDAEAFGELYDRQVAGVYRYLLAWSQDKATAEQLTEKVFGEALRSLPLVAWRESELGARLTGMARDAVVEQREAAGSGGQERGDEPPGGGEGGPLRAIPWERLRPAVARLDDEKREVVVLRFLLGHSVVHTAHLMGQSAGAITALQIRACASLANLLGRDQGRRP